MTCARCGHRMFAWWVPRCGWMWFCLLCGECWDQQIAVNRVLMALGCRTPVMFAAAYRAMWSTAIRQELVRGAG